MANKSKANFNNKTKLSTAPASPKQWERFNFDTEEKKAMSFALQTNTGMVMVVGFLGIAEEFDGYPKLVDTKLVQVNSPCTLGEPQDPNAILRDLSAQCTVPSDPKCLTHLHNSLTKGINS